MSPKFTKAVVYILVISFVLGIILSVIPAFAMN